MKLNIALIGTRGVPASYGGFETCVQEIGKRLVARGHSVTVYCRDKGQQNPAQYYLGMKRVILPALKSKSFETLSHTFFSVFHALGQQFDIYMLFNAANAPFVVPLRAMSKKVAVNTDGLEWKRSKWGRLGKTYYKLSEKIACAFANRLVADSVGIHDYYATKHQTESSIIAYGADIPAGSSAKLLKKFGLESRNYFLQITRFEPENHPLLTIEAYKRLNTGKKLVLVGGNPYKSEYVNKIISQASDTICLPGFIYDDELLATLWCHAFAYIHGNSVGGTNPALLQAMAAGCYTLAYDVPFNREVLQGCGVYYGNNASDLAAKMGQTMENCDKLETYRELSRQRIKDHYSWDTVAGQYEALFYELVENKFPCRLNWHAFKV